MNRGYVMIIISMLLWGSIGLFVREINQPPEVIVFFRVFIAFISMLFIGRINKEKINNKLVKKDLLYLLFGGIFLSLNWMFFFKAIKTTTIASATLSYYTAPVIVTYLSVIILKEVLNKKTLLAVFLSFLGIIIMILNPDVLNENFNSIGVLYGLIAALFYALVTISGKKLSNISSKKIVLIQTLVASIMFLPALKNLNDFDMISFIFLLIIGIIHTSLALTLYFEGIKKIKVQHVGVLSYIDPLSAVIFGIIFLKEIPSIPTIIGGIFILLSTYVILKRKNKLKKKTA
ncbi:MAG: EamA/RhaT family transporter [Firmicutes bacterium]|nr:EamA/RhaT family transporter [Bacillota bacterium]